MTETFFHRFTDIELEGLRRLKEFAANWGREHQTTLGVTEMALGAAMLTAGWQNGAIQIGVDFVVRKLSPGWAAELTGASGAGLGGLAGYIIGNIGVTAMGTGFAIPALVLAGGAALIFGLAGYTGARLLEDLLHRAPNLDQLLEATSMVALGAWLLVDGAQRVPLVRDTVAFARDTGLKLARVANELVIDSATAFATLVHEEFAPFMQKLVSSGAGPAFIGAAGLGAVGAAVAPSLVTVAGSSTVGGVALSMGLVSAPVWPIVAGVGMGLAAGYGLWSFLRRESPPPESPNS